MSRIEIKFGHLGEHYDDVKYCNVLEVTDQRDVIP